MRTASWFGRPDASSRSRGKGRPNPSGPPAVADERTERLAQVLVDYSTEVGEGDLVVVDTSPLAAPLARALYRRVLDAGGHPQVRMSLGGATEALLSQGSDDQLEWVNPARKE